MTAATRNLLLFAASFHAKPPSTTVDGAGCLPLPPASAAGATATTTSQ